MKKVNASDLPWDELNSPQGRFVLSRKDISLAMGAPKDLGRPNGHAFDVALHRIPPGKHNCPLHAHSQQTEFYIVVSGQGQLRQHIDENTEVTETLEPGDCIHCPPNGTAHQIFNSGDEDLVFWVIADNPPAESIYYPDSDKWAIKPERKWFKATPVDYFEGEE
ncbi:MAG: cupin domain-containing protein [Verrucomicrobiota bacterium]